MKKLPIGSVCLIFCFSTVTVAFADILDAPPPPPPLIATSATSTPPVKTAVATTLSAGTAMTSAAAGTTTAGEASTVAVADYIPVISLIPSLVHNNGWKTTERYDFSDIAGLQDSYSVNEQIVFSFAGSSSSLAVEKTNGFNVVVTLFDPSRNLGRRAFASYDLEKKHWLAKLAVPEDATTEYKLVLNLFCEKSASPCADIFGFGTQIDKIIPVIVR